MCILCSVVTSSNGNNIAHEHSVHPEQLVRNEEFQYSSYCLVRIDVSVVSVVPEDHFRDSLEEIRVPARQIKPFFF